MTVKSKDRLDKIKSRLIYYLEKMVKIQTELNKYEEMVAGLNTRKNSEIQGEDGSIYESVKRLNLIFSLKEDDDVTCLNQSVNDTSVNKKLFTY